MRRDLRIRAMATTRYFIVEPTKTMNPLTVCILEIPMDLADRWDAMLKTDGRSATYWEIAKWAYEKGRTDERKSQEE